MPTRIHNALRQAVCALGLFCLTIPMAAALDYVIRPTPPEMVKDAATVFLADLSQPPADPASAAQNRAMGLVAEKFLADGGYRGAVTVPVPAGRAWTIEMILKLPADTARAAKPINLGGWQTADNTSLRFGLHPSGGPGWTLSAPPRPNARQYPFAFGANSGGDAAALGKDAPDRWVHVTMGLDLDNRLGAAMIRDMEGNVLNKDMRFARTALLNAEFATRLPEDQRAGAIEQCWKEIQRTFPRTPPASFKLGADEIVLRAVRVSNRFRPEIALPSPAFAGMEGKPWKAPDLDAARAVKETATRSIGYNDHNARPMPFEESYIPLAPGQVLPLPPMKLPIGLYSLWVYGSVDPKGRAEIGRVWQPAPMEFEVKDAAGRRVGWGRMLLKQSFAPRFMQAFSFHVDEPGEFTATLRIMDRAQETARIHQVNLVDTLEGLPDQAVKTAQRLEEGKTAQLNALTDARRQRDAAIWNGFPPLNVHTVHQTPPPWRKLPEGVTVPTWEFAAALGRRYGSIANTIAPLDILNPATKEQLPHEQVIAGDPLPGTPTDDGTGIFFRKADHPDLAQDMYWFPRAELMLQRMMNYFGLIVGPGSSGNTPQFNLGGKYFETGDPDTGHDAAMALARVAYDFPALEYGVQDLRLCTADPDLEFNQHWSYGRGGKAINWSWSADEVRGMIETYDKIFPYIQGNQLLADEVGRFVPWVKTPQDVIRLIDRQLVFAAVRDVRRGFLSSGRRIEDTAGDVLGPGPLTADLFDLTKQFAYLHPFRGTFQEGYATGLSRSGTYYTGSFLTYALGSAKEHIAKAYSMLLLKGAGVPPKMDISDVNRYPKIAAASSFILDMWVAGGFPFMVGDASGGPHTEPIAYQRLDLGSERKAFSVAGDPRHAWVLRDKLASKDADVLKAAEGQRDPILHNTSRVVPDFGAILELNPEEADLTKKTGVTLRLGIGQGHAHADFLDVNFFAMGLPMSVDLACRNEGTQTWSRPGANWSFLHNHAVAHDTDDPRLTPGQEGEPWLRAFAPPLMRGSYVSGRGDTHLERDLILMEIGDTGTFYAFDVQRLSGGKTHTWCFHGCESHDLALNVPMEPKTVRWIDRTLEGTHKVGASADTLQATWTMTREARDVKHSFQNGGIVKTVACEPVVLGKAYDPKLPPARMRATLLGHGGEQVMQGNPYSQSYAYCFPFLWVQGPAKETSVYPAVYEWYRGDATVVAKAELLTTTPLTARVTTASGQVDEYTSTPEGFSAVSRDAKGLRWAKFNGLARFDSAGLSFEAATAQYETPILSMDHNSRTLRTQDKLPANPGVCIGSPDRWSRLELKGQGTEFTWKDDLLIGGGTIQSIKVTGPDSVDVKTNQGVLFDTAGNRKAAGLTSTNEDGTWHFRGGKVVLKPQGATLTDQVFTDANGDGFVMLKTYEAGIGNRILLPADITVRRAAPGWEIRTNVQMRGKIGATAFALEPKEEWQGVK